MEELDSEEQFLRDARNGNLPGIQRLLMSKIKGETTFDVNCKGKNRSNFGWTPLHLSCYFGHRDVVEELLKAGADANLTNNVGDTPLHKAAFTGRQEVVMLLLQYDACPSVINGSAQIPKDITHDDEIRSMLEAAERTEERKLEEQVLEAAREGATTTLLKLLNRKKPPNINCTDLLGNTPLHCAAYRGQKQCAVKLLQNGANPNIKNKNGQTVIDLAKDMEMRLILEGSLMKGPRRYVQIFEGPLWKSTRFFGWRSCWVVLQDGLLSWYSKQSDAASNSQSKGCKALTQAQCSTKDSCYFTVKCFDDSIHYFKVSPKGDPVATRKKWLEAIEAHSAFSTHYCSQDQGSEEDEDEVVSLGELTESLQWAETCHGKLESEVLSLLSMVKEDALCEGLPMTVLQKFREVCDASSETCSTLRQCLDLFSKQEGARSLKLEQEVEKNKILSEALQTLATEHHELERSVVQGSSPRSAILSEDDFYDALSYSDSEHSQSCLDLSRSLEEGEESNSELYYRVPRCLTGGRMSQEDWHGDEEEEDEGTKSSGPKKHRTSLPAPMFSRNNFSIWSILRKCIGMELSKITMPVIFNEPLSFLQRLTEYMEHTYLILQANDSTDSIERMKCVAAFAVSAVASQWDRTGKPFNPLLGETYELVREDLGFRVISEQVSHHPPVSAFHAEGLQKDFAFHGSIYPKLKFWGKSVEAEPKGIMTLELPKYNEAFTWTNPTCCVHNIIVGQLWIEQYGNVEVINHRTGEKCCLSFKPCGLFGKELHKVEGYILDKSKKKVCVLYGKWTECMYTVDPATFEAHKKNDKVTEGKKSKKEGSSAESEESPQPGSDSLEVIPGSQLLWKIAPRPANSTQMYSFTLFAMQLNELDEETKAVIPKTDCRLRPDIRAMENGDIDLASEEKKRLEEKQRAARKNWAKSDEDWKMRWFHQGPNPYTNSPDWLFSTAYWNRDYSQFSGELGEQMKESYGVFCSRHTEAVNYYKEQLHSNKKFQNHIRKINNLSIVRRLGIPECILLVTQRITKYPVLVERILQYTEANTEEHEELARALGLIRSTIMQVDAQVNLYEKETRLREIAAKMEPKAFGKIKDGRIFRREDLTQGKRRLLFEGTVNWKAASGRLKDILALLLTDVLLLLQDKDQRYVFSAVDGKPSVISLQKLIIREVAHEEKAMFLICASSNEPEMYEIHTSSKEERNTWITHIRQAVDSCPHTEERLCTEEEDIRLQRFREIQEHLTVKDAQIRQALADKLRLYADLAECVGLEDTGTRGHLLLRGDTSELQQGEQLLRGAITEVENLQNVLVSGGRGFLQTEENESSNSLPKRAGTFGGYDSTISLLQKQGSIKRHSAGAGKSRERSQRASSDPQLKEMCTSQGLEEADNISLPSWNMICSRFPNTEIYGRVLLLCQQLYSLQAIVSQQDSVIELQRVSLFSVERQRGTDVLLEQEKQRNLEKHREEMAHFQRVQAQQQQEQERWERERARQLKQNEAEHLQLQEREDACRKLEERFAQERLELQNQRQKYQQDLERLRESTRAVEKEREKLEQQRKMKKRNTAPITATTYGHDTVQLPMSSSFNGDILGNSGTDSIPQSLSQLRPTVSSSAADYSERIEMPPRRESGTTLSTKTEVPIHLVSTTNQLHKQGGVQQQIPTKLATLKSKDKSSKSKGSHRTDSTASVDMKQMLKLSSREMESSVKARRSVSPHQQPQCASPPITDPHIIGDKYTPEPVKAQSLLQSYPLPDDKDKEDVIFF